MKTEITLYRSKEWVAAKQLETGDNISERVRCEFDVSLAPRDVREMLMAHYDSYRSRYDDLLVMRRGQHAGAVMCYGRATFQCDADDPSHDDVCEAIRQAHRKATEKLEQEITKDATEKAEVARAAEELARRKQELGRARELLKDEISELEGDVATLRRERNTIAKFVTKVPLDALRGALKAQAQTEDRVAELQKEIEDASPYWVFENRDENEDDE